MQGTLARIGRQARDGKKRKRMRAGMFARRRLGAEQCLPASGGDGKKEEHSSNGPDFMPRLWMKSATALKPLGNFVGSGT